MFVLSPGNAHLPDELKFVYAMIALLSEGKYDVIIPAPNRELEAKSLRPFRSELRAVWSDISNAMRGFKNHSLHTLVLDELMGLELSNISRQLKLKPGVNGDYRVIVGVSIDLWFRGMEIKEEGEKRHNAKKNESSLGSYGFANEARGKHVAALDHSNSSIGQGRFEQGPAMTTNIHAYLAEDLNLVENAEEKSAEFINRMCQITLEVFWAQNARGEEGFEKTESMLEGLGA